MFKAEKREKVHVTSVDWQSPKVSERPTTHVSSVAVDALVTNWTKERKP